MNLFAERFPRSLGTGWPKSCWQELKGLEKQKKKAIATSKRGSDGWKDERMKGWKDERIIVLHMKHPVRDGGEEEGARRSSTLAPSFQHQRLCDLCMALWHYGVGWNGNYCHVLSHIALIQVVLTPGQTLPHTRGIKCSSHSSFIQTKKDHTLQNRHKSKIML